jgi:hypothetical protein
MSEEQAFLAGAFSALVLLFLVILFNLIYQGIWRPHIRIRRCKK